MFVFIYTLEGGNSNFIEKLYGCLNSLKVLIWGLMGARLDLEGNG